MTSETAADSGPMDDHLTLERIEVFTGRLTTHEAHLYVRLPGLAGGADWQLTGQLTGPRSEFATTLPHTVPLQDLGSGETLLARAVVPDPSFWSPATPTLYRLQIQLQGAGPSPPVRQFDVGFRPLAVRDQDLRFENRRWVARGIVAREPLGEPLDAWRDASATLVVDAPSQALCVEADRRGVLIVARLTNADTLIGDLRRLSQHPSVWAAVVPNGPRESELTLSQAAGNLLLVRQVSRSDSAPEWGDVEICDADSAVTFRERRTKSRPCLVQRQLQTAKFDLPALRTACDVLQRDLARDGDFAGYVIEPIDDH